MKVEIGGGTKPLIGYQNFDPTEPGEWSGRLGYDPIPTGDETVTSVYASHVLEHIPQGQPRIDAFNEVWRVLKPGGDFVMFMPIIGWTDDYTGESLIVKNWRAWADPTHVSYWWLPESLYYFTDHPNVGASADYGIKKWDLVEWEVNGGWEGRAVLRKP